MAFLYALWFIFVFLRFDVDFNIRNCCASAFGRKELEVNVNALFFFFFWKKSKKLLNFGLPKSFNMLFEGKISGGELYNF